MTLSTDERRALGLIAGLILLASGARWLERPQPLLADAPSVDLAALEDASRDARPERATRPAQPLRIDPNTASAPDLTRIPGIGPALADRIVEERARAPFRTVDDLQRVHGIGAALAKRMALHVALPNVGAATTTPVFPSSTPVQTAPKPPFTEGPREPFDINEIGSSDLQKVPGVGPVLAARILARRDSLGRFTGWDQVDAIAGVGPAMLSRLRESTVLRP